MNRTTTLTLAVATALLAVPAAALAADTATPPPPARTVDISFVKHLVNPTTVTFKGVTAGAIRGRLTSHLVAQTAPPTSEYEFVRFRWTITSRERSLVAVTDGTLDTTTGVVAMTGTVTRGWHKGDEILERGELIDPATETFTGDLVLLTRCAQPRPASSLEPNDNLMACANRPPLSRDM